jgi:hypothetical protein
MSNLNSLLQSSASGWKNMQNEAAGMASKWGKTGLLEGLSSEVDKNSMAMILENQAKQLVVESNATDQGGGTFQVGTGAQWAGVALPLVRKVFGALSTKEFMSVQPMNLPSGLVFFLDFQYGNTKKLNFGPAGEAFTSPGSLYGNTNPANGADPSGGLYGAGRFAYTTNQFTASATATFATASWASVNYDAELSASVAADNLGTLTITSSALTRPDFKGVRAFAISGSDANESFILPAYTTTNGQTITFVLASGSLAATGTADVYYNQQPVDNNRGDFEDANGAGRPNANSVAGDQLAIPEIDVKLKSEAIVAKTKKLKAQWTPEFAQDLNAYQSLDAEAELTSIMSEYISLEIDLENLDMLIQDASAADEYWSAVNNKSLNSARTGYDNLGFLNSQGQWFQTLGTKMQKVSNKIHQKTLRGGANFMVVSPTVATILEAIPGFASSSDGDAAKMSYAFGIQKSGQLNNRFTVYKNPYMTENVILMGYRGSQFLETGAVFSPYVPLIMTPLVYDPETFTPRKGLLTRYAKKMIRSEFYGRIFVSDLASI